MKIKYLYLCTLFSVKLFYGQEGALEHAIRYKYNPLIRENHFEKMIFKMDLNSDVNSFRVPNLGNENHPESRFYPNQKLKLRYSFDYKFLGIFLATSPKFLPGNNTVEKGKTSTFDLSFKFFYSDRLRQEVDYKTIRGFYLEVPTLPNEIELFPNLTINTIGGKTFYILNNNFSYRAFDNMTERQLVSAGSLIPSVAYYFSTLTTSQENKGKRNLDKINSIDGLLQIGYIYNFVFSKKWFTTIGVHPGLGYNSSTSYFETGISDKERKVKYDKFNLNYDLNLSLGYNNKDFFSGFKYLYRDYKFSDNLAVPLINSKSRFEFFIGYRLKAPKRIKNTFEAVEAVF
jgi:hypothetical protein